jgi:hypothetical protein
MATPFFRLIVKIVTVFDDQKSLHEGDCLLAVLRNSSEVPVTEQVNSVVRFHCRFRLVLNTYAGQGWHQVPAFIISTCVGRSQWVCCRSLAGIVGSKTAGALMSVSCVCCVLSGRGLCVGLITRPGEFYLVRCV